MVIDSPRPPQTDSSGKKIISQGGGGGLNDRNAQYISLNSFDKKMLSKENPIKTLSISFAGTYIHPERSSESIYLSYQSFPLRYRLQQSSRTLPA